MKYYRYLFLFYFIAHYANVMIFEYYPQAESWSPNSIMYLVFLPIVPAIVLSIVTFINKFSLKKYLMGLLWSILGLLAANIVGLLQQAILNTDNSFYWDEQAAWLLLLFIIECVIVIISTSILFPPLYLIVKKFKK